jgi:hypothetical protein
MKSFSRSKAQVQIMQGREGRRGGEEEGKKVVGVEAGVM